jgi:hypothetical protein
LRQSARTAGARSVAPSRPFTEELRWMVAALHRPLQELAADFPVIDRIWR